MTLLEPHKSLSHLIYIGYPANPTSAFRITRRRRQDRKRQRSQRVVLQCYVFGATNAGKSALLNALIGRYDTFVWFHCPGDKYAVRSILMGDKNNSIKNFNILITSMFMKCPFLYTLLES